MYCTDATDYLIAIRDDQKISLVQVTRALFPSGQETLALGNPR